MNYKALLFILLCSTLVNAITVNCANPNQLYNGDYFHKGSELTCLVDSNADCTAYLLNSVNHTLEHEIETYEVTNGEVIIYKDLSEYAIEYGITESKDIYRLDITCGLEEYLYNFTVTAPDRYCYMLPYLSINLCTPIMTDYGNFLKFVWNRIDVIIGTPVIVILLYGLSVLIRLAYHKIRYK